MSDGYLLAVDAGTGSCRAVLFDPHGQQCATASCEWSHPELPEFPGSQVFETDSNWSSICSCIRNVLQQIDGAADSVLAVSTTSMREGIVLYDSTDREIWACPNVDARASAEAAELVNNGSAEKIYELSGDWVAITSSPRLRWIRANQPDIFGRIAHLTMLSDWILFKLCGEYATDPSIGSSSGLFDLKKRTWSDEILSICDLNPAVCPAVREPGTVIGTVHRQSAIETGLTQGTPVVVGGADTQLGLVGIGQIQPGHFTVVGGTFWQHTVGVTEPVIDPERRLRTLCHALPNQWMAEGIGFYCGLTMRWFRDAFCQAEVEQARRLQQDAYAMMESLAAQAPAGANGVIGLFSNFMQANRWIHAPASFLQFDVASPGSSGKKECIRAIEESAAYVSLGHMQIIESLLRRQFEEAVFTGGAAKGTLWPQILADVLNCRVHVPVVKESTALGAAMFAALGVGLYTNLSDLVPNVVRFERTFEPNPDTHAAYSKLFEQWCQLYTRALNMVEDGLARPLWRAAGT